MGNVQSLSDSMTRYERMAKISPKACTAIPASTNAAVEAEECNSAIAAMTITHPAARKRNPAILISLHAFLVRSRVKTDAALFLRRLPIEFIPLYATLGKCIGPIEIFDSLQKLEDNFGRGLPDTMLLDMTNLLSQIVANRSGVLAVLLMGAFLEAYGDSCFQAGLYRSRGISRILVFLIGAASLSFYGLVVNVPRWDFGRVLGVYVVLFFLCAQVIARVRFGQSPTLAVIAGGALITAGGVIITVFGA